MADFKKDLSEMHVRLDDILQDLERQAEMDADRGEHCLKYFNEAIDRWMPSFEYVKAQATNERISN